MIIRIVAILLLLLPLVVSSSCQSSTTEYVTTSEFAEYRRKREQADQAREIVETRTLQHYKWLAKIEMEACESVNSMFSTNNVEAHCVEVVITGDRGRDGFPAIALLMADGEIHRCPALLTWGRDGELHIYPVEPPEDAANLTNWRELL